MFVLPSNAGPPLALTFRIKAPAFTSDLTTGTAFSVGVRRPDASIATWTGVIVASTPSEMIAQYALQAGDLTVTGAYQLQPRVTVPAGSVPCRAMTLLVSTPYNGVPILEDETWLIGSTTIPGANVAAWTWSYLTTGSHALIANAPWIAVDCTGGAVSASLWAANDGDVLVLSDYLASIGATNTFTLAAQAGAQVPLATAGTYGASRTFTAPLANGGALRLKFSVAKGLWLPW